MVGRSTGKQSWEWMYECSLMFMLEEIELFHSDGFVAGRVSFCCLAE